MIRVFALLTRCFCGVVTRLFDVGWQIVLDNVFFFFSLWRLLFWQFKKKKKNHPSASLSLKTSVSFGKKDASSRVKMFVERLLVIFVSFILNGAERLRHASTCWHSFVYSVRPDSLWVWTEDTVAALEEWRGREDSRPVPQTFFLFSLF